jgi:uncharacterized RDD family membrane protein YckC
MTSMVDTLPSASSGASTGSHRVLRVRAATFARRASAATVDAAIVTALATGATALAALMLGVQLPAARELGPDLIVAGILDRNPMVVGGFGLWLGLSALYHVYLGGVVGQTPGKRLAGLRVISIRGTTPGPLRAAGRFLALIASVGPVGLGWIWALFDRERRGLHDHLAGTHVVIDE